MEIQKYQAPKMTKLTMLSMQLEFTRYVKNQGSITNTQ